MGWAKRSCQGVLHFTYTARLPFDWDTFVYRNLSPKLHTLYRYDVNELYMEFALVCPSLSSVLSWCVHADLTIIDVARCRDGESVAKVS